MYNNIPKSQTILGISPGTRVLGLAILQHEELQEWKVKTLNGKWSKTKLKAMLSFIDGIIDRYRADTMVVKILHQSRQSIGLKALIAALGALAKIKHCTYFTCTITDLKQLYKYYEVRNKSDLIQAIVLKHPELIREKNKEEKNRNKYYTKMFEAVACAHTCEKRQSR